MRRMVGRHCVECIALASCLAVTAGQNVAIVGSGVAGASASYFLRELQPGVDIDVYEAEPEVGGRAHTLSDFGVFVDAGATSISTQNNYLVSFVKKFQFAKSNDNRSDTLALWDGRGFRFVWPDGVLLPFRALARYGLDPLRIFGVVRGAVSNLTKIYSLQAQGKSFESPQDMFDTLGLTELTQISGYDFFPKQGVHDSFIREFIDGASRDNYGQPSTINAFVDLVSLAGAGIDGSVFTLEKGTSQIPKALLSSGGQQVKVILNTSVRSVELTANGVFNVSSSSTSSAHTGLASKEYDAVIIATPLESARGLQLVGGADINRTRPYQQTCVTFVSGVANPRYFGLEITQKVPTEILTTDNTSLPFKTLAVHADLGNDTFVYKMFSEEPLGDDVLDAVFKRRHRTRRLVWNAYPKLNPTPTSTWPPFMIEMRARASEKTSSIAYTGAMESPVSCMETQIIAAKNAALRVAQILGRESGISTAQSTLVI